MIEAIEALAKKHGLPKDVDIVEWLDHQLTAGTMYCTTLIRLTQALTRAKVTACGDGNHATVTVPSASRLPEGGQIGVEIYEMFGGEGDLVIASKCIAPNPQEERPLLQVAGGRA